MAKKTNQTGTHSALWEIAGLSILVASPDTTFTFTGAATNYAFYDPNGHARVSVGALDTIPQNAGDDNLVLRNTGSGAVRFRVPAGSFDYPLFLPAAQGAAGFALVNDGAGNLSWQNIGATSDTPSYKNTALSFGSAATVPAGTLAANAQMLEIRVYVDTPFSAGAQMTLGTAASPALYSAANECDLTEQGLHVIYVSVPPNASAQTLQITYAANGATAGAARVVYSSVIPA